MSGSRGRVLGALALSALLAAGSNLVLRAAMAGLAADGHGEGLLLRALASPVVLGALAGYGASHLLWLNVLSQARLGAAFPIYVSAMFVMVLAGSALALGEALTPERVGGAVLVAAGIAVAEWRRGGSLGEGAAS